jgi:hypothetical protein
LEIYDQLAVANEVIFKIEQAQDNRSMSPKEVLLRKELKVKYLGLALLQRTIARQRFHLTFLSAGDTNMKFFHLQACHRGR